MSAVALHLSAEERKRLVALDTSARETFQWVTHLLICSDCRRRLHREWPFQSRLLAWKLFDQESWPTLSNGPGELSPEYQRLVGVLQRRLEDFAQDLEESRALLLNLQSHPLARQRLLLRNSSRFLRVGLAWFLTEKARFAWETAPPEALGLLDLVLLICEGLPPAEASRDTTQVLIARALTYRANCRRILSDYQGAEVDFQSADEILARCRCRSEDRALLWEFWSSLRREQRRFDESRSLAGRAREVFERMGDRSAIVRMTLLESMTLRHLHRPDEALRLLEALAVSPLAEDMSLRDELLLTHNRTCYLNDTGRSHEALALLPRIRELAAHFPEDFQMVRIEWLEAEICQKVGWYERALERFEHVLNHYLHCKATFDAAYASLDLTAVLLQLGQTERAKELAVSVLPVFQAHELPEEAVTVLTLFYRAVEREEATVALAREVAARLDRSDIQAARSG